MSHKLYLLAGEASGDALGAALLRGFGSLGAAVDVHGVGGAGMAAEGLQSLFPMDELSVMGIAEVLPKYAHLRRRLHQTADDVVARKPDALITIDSPDFSLRLAKLVRQRSPEIRTVHYVAPSVWAWRAGRAKKMARHIDQVLALLPFEPPYMEAAGMRCDFVGHPVVTEPVASEEDAARFRHARRIGDAPLLLVLPGSRRSELARLLPVFGETLALLSRKVPELGAVLPAAPGLAETVRQGTREWTVAPYIIETDGPDGAEQKRTAFAAADAALAASGTVSLELAANATPMVIAYDLNWLSWQIMSRMVRVDTVTLVNLVSGTRAVPEFLGPECKPEAIAEALSPLLSDPGTRAGQLSAMAETMRRLGKGGEAPGLRAARAVLDGLS